MSKEIATYLVPVNTIVKNPNNPRIIKDFKYSKLVDSLRTFPKMQKYRPIIVNDKNVILGGNQRYTAAVEVGMKEVWVQQASDFTEEEQQEFIIKDNVNFGEWDWDILANEWDTQQLNEWGMDLWQDEQPGEEEEQRNPLTETFIIPPFSILDTRQGHWKERKKIWHDLIQDKGESRELTLSKSENLMSEINSGVSLLDPVLAEIANRWFGLKNCNTFDCFAGDSVFGYVSNALGNNFTGIELRQEQTDLNNQRLKGSRSKYICDDGQNVAEHIEANSQDLLFSCPPYFDLEVYSELENDASNQKDYKAFLKILDNAFTASIKCLKDNRFAFIVVGDLRGKDGAYYNFPNDVKNIFLKAGMVLYNEMILVEPLGTLPQRVRRYMNNRKVGKCHQNIFVFYKGQTSEIQNTFKELNIEIDES